MPFYQEDLARIGGNGSVNRISDHGQVFDLVSGNLPRAGVERHSVEIDARHPFA
jgi:hypothetical protein